jgi:hypothetical protein
MHARAPNPGPLAIYGIVGFTLSLLVHLLSYAGVAAQEHVPLTMLLHVAIFPLFLVFILRVKRWETGSWWNRGLRWRAMLPYLPVWARVAVPLLFVYATINFFTSMSRLPPHGAGGGPAPPSYEAAVYDARLFSGHWLVFYAVPTLFFLFLGDVDPRKAEESAA